MRVGELTYWGTGNHSNDPLQLLGQWRMQYTALPLLTYGVLVKFLTKTESRVTLVEPGRVIILLYFKLKKHGLRKLETIYSKLKSKHTMSLNITSETWKLVLTSYHNIIDCVFNIRYFVYILSKSVTLVFTFKINAEKCTEQFIAEWLKTLDLGF